MGSSHMLCLLTSVVNWDGQEVQQLALMLQETSIRITASVV